MQSNIADGEAKFKMQSNTCSHAMTALDSIEQWMTNDKINEALTNGTFDNQKGAIIAFSHKRSNTDMTETLRIINIDMWSILFSESDG